MLRPESIFSNLRISNKLFLLNLMIVAAFILVAGIIIFSFVIVRNKVTEVANKDVRIVTANSQTARMLSKVFSDIELLSHTFYKKNTYLHPRSTRLADLIKNIEESSTDPDLKMSLLSLSKQFDAFLSQCAVVNTVLRDRESIDRETHIELTRLENLIAELFVKSTLAGEDTSFVEQLLMLVVGYRESLLQIGKMFADLVQENCSLLWEGKTSPLITFFDDLILRLQTITASIPEVRRYGEKIVNNVQKYKQAVLMFHKVMESLRSRITNLNQSKISTMSAMASIDKKISSATLQTVDSIEKIIIYSGITVLLVSIMVIISLGFATTYLIRSNIKDPMKKILKGIESFSKKSLETQIELNRRDEWDIIEQSLNKMANELLKSYTELRESEEKYRNILESIEEGYYEVDLDGNFTFCNDAFCRIANYSKDDLLGKNYQELTAPETIKEVYSVFKNVYQTQESVKEFEWDLIRKDGIKPDLELSISLIKDPEGHRKGFRGVIRDITERKNIEAHLRESSKMEAIGTLAGGIAHEFNNALTGIVGNTQLLEMEFPENGCIRQYCELLKVSSNRMADLTSQLLSYARGGKYQAETMSLCDFVENTLPIVKSGIDPSIRVETELPRDKFIIMADPTQIQMVLSAVISNSSEAIEGEGRIRISISNEEIDAEYAKSHSELSPGRYVCLTVKDDGKGMDEETISKIFDPFYTTKFMGRGLGMAAVYGIIRNHDGGISVDSHLGKGTVVCIYLPAIEVEEEVSQKTDEETKMISGTGTILVIKDEEMVLNVTRTVLVRLGYRVLEAKTGCEATEIAKTFDGNIDLALLDIKLPDISGEKVYPLIMEARPNMKVIVCSGYSIDSPARTILDAGAQDFIQKPFRIETLSKKIKKVLGNRSIGH